MQRPSYVQVAHHPLQSSGFSAVVVASAVEECRIRAQIHGPLYPKPV